MLHNLRRPLLMLLLASNTLVVFAQNQFPIDDWKSKLEVKKDVCAVNRRAVFQSIMELDSANRCSALYALENSAIHDEAKIQIRVNLIKFALARKNGACPQNSQGFPTPEESLQKAYELEDHQLAAELNFSLGQFHLGRTEYSMSVMYLLMGWEMARKIGLENFNDISYMLYSLGNALYQSHDYQAAAYYNLLAIQYRMSTRSGEVDTLNTYWKMNTWNGLGLCYERLQVYDSAVIAFNYAYDLAGKIENNRFWLGLLKGNLGDVFFFQGQYDSAVALLQFDYEQSRASNNNDNAAMSLARLARIRNSKGDHTGALTMLREAQQLVRGSTITDYLKSIPEAMAIVFRDLGQADSVYIYLNEAKRFELKAESQAAQNRMDIVQLRMNNEQNIHRILQLNKEKNRIKLIRNFIIVLAILGAAFGFLYFNRQRLKMRLRQQEALEAKSAAEAKAKAASEQLNDFTQRVLEKTNLVEKLQDELKQRELSEEQLHYINELSQHSILTDADWEQFKNLFEKVYPGFFIRLKNEVPDITIAEQRMAALSKLQVSAKEAATLLGISHNSVNKTRSRLRQRLGLHPEIDLETYFAADGK